MTLNDEIAGKNQLYKTNFRDYNSLRSGKMKDHDYPRVFLKVLESLGLPKDHHGIQSLQEIMQADKIAKILMTEDEYETCVEKIEGEIFPEIIGKHPELSTLLQQPEFKEIRFHTLARWLNYLVEDLALLSGNRPLPFPTTPVKNILHLGSGSPGPEFGFLTWTSPGCRITITAENGKGYGERRPIREIEYKTMIDALMDGWKVD